MARPELVGSILPKTELTQPDERVARIEQLAQQANEARHAFTNAVTAVNMLTVQENEILGELMQASLDMHEAKLKVDAILKEIRTLAGLI
jgi:hypothetical protein